MATLHSGVAQAANTTLASDGVFGPQYGTTFDFTMVFDNTIFTTLPITLAIGACPIYAYWYYHKAFVTSKKNVLWAKLVLTLCLLAFELARSIVWHSVEDPDGSALLHSTTLAAIVLSDVYPVTLAISLAYDHLYAPQSTTFLSLFLFVSTLTEGVRLRSFSLRDGMDVVSGLTIGCIVIKALLILLLEMPKTLDSPAYKDKDKDLVWDDKAGFWGRVLVVCANSTFFRGFRNHLTMHDLGVLAPTESSELLAARFEPIWKSTNKKSRGALFKACFWAMRWHLLAAWIPCACKTVLDFVNIFVMQMTLENFQNPDAPVYTSNAVIGANVLVYVAQTINNSLFLREKNILSLHIRGTLIGQMAKKTTELATDQAQQSALLGLMTADVDGIIGGVEEMFQLTLVLPALATGFYFLQQQVGNAFFSPVIPIVLSVVIGMYTGAQTIPAMRQWNESIQSRVAKTAIVIAQSNGIKMLGLEATMVKYLETLREFEVSQSMKVRKLRVMTITALPLNYWLTPTVVFVCGVYWTVWKDTGLDPVKPWVAMAFIGLIRIPMWYLLKSWGVSGVLFACVDRLQEYLLLTEKPDIRRLEPLSNGRTSTSSRKHGARSKEKPSASATMEDEPSSCCISMRTVSVASSQPGRNILQNVDLDIPTSKLTMIVGPVGSGKTVFLKTLLGETVATGNIEMASFNIAYCDQKTWLPSGTIQNAITEYMEFDQSRYDDVIAACSLGPDITALGGSDAQIGSNGAMLSGGQRQRVALARALYSRNPIVICDDVLSALDSRTARDVFNAVFSESGMLKKEARTVLFATHERAWVGSADQVIHLSDEGLATVHRGKEAVDRFLESNSLVVGISTTDATSAESKETPRDRELAYARQDKEKPADKLDTSLYRYLFRPIPLLRIIWALLLIGFNGFMERGPDVFIRIWLARDPMNNSYAISMVVLSFFTMVTTGYGAYVYYIEVIPDIARHTHSTFANAVLRATLPFLTSTSNGVLINRFSQDMTLFGQEMPMALYNALHITAIYVTNIGLVVAGTDYTAIAVPIFILILWFLQKFYVRTSRQVRLLDLEAKTPLYDMVAELVSGVEHIRSYGWTHHVITSFHKCLDYSQRGYYSMLTIQRWLNLVADILGVMMAAVLVSTAMKTRAASQPSLGLALLSMTHFGALSKIVIERWTTVETSLGAVMRLRDFERDTPRETDDPEAKGPPDSWPTQGLVEFKSVSASYQLEGGEVTPALESVSVKFTPGQRVLITGRTGSGKSTMMLVMLNLVKYEGEILIDHKDIAKIPYETLRQKITMIPQDALNIPGSTLQNLLPLDNSKERSVLISDDLIKKVLQDVTIWDHIEAKGGHEVPFEEMHFSAGQKQLLSIARAILHQIEFKTNIILMDEVTSNLDNNAREAVLSTMNTAFRGCTRIEISHNVKDAAQCDVTVTLSNGRLLRTDVVGQTDNIVERGSPGSTVAGPSPAEPEPETSEETNQEVTTPESTSLEQTNSNFEQAAPESMLNLEQGSAQS